MKMLKLGDEVEEKDTELIILEYEMDGIQNKLKDIIRNELKEGCIELLNKIVKLPDHTRKVFEVVIDAELESPAETTVDESIIASGLKDNLWTKLLGMRVEEVTTEVDSLKEKLSKYQAAEDQGSEYFDNENFIETSGISNQEEFPEVFVPELVKQPVITKKRNRLWIFRSRKKKSDLTCKKNEGSD